jgi:trehalose 6-phosphate synthase
LERLKGIPLKLISIQNFISKNPKWIGKIVFALIGVSALERGDDYKQTQIDVTMRVRYLNDTYSHENIPLVYFEERSERDIRLPQRLSFFAASDILMCTATRFNFILSLYLKVKLYVYLEMV